MKIKMIKEVFGVEGARIGKEAMKDFERALDKYAKKLAEITIRTARLSGRKVIKKQDIIKASELLR